MSDLQHFFLSFWEGPTPDGDIEAKCAEVAECNFTYLAVPRSSPKGNLIHSLDVETNMSMLDACAKAGIKYIIPDERILQGETTDLEAVLADYAGHPANGGYFLGDEPCSSDFEVMARANAFFTERDPGRLPYMNLFPDYASLEQLGTPSYEEHVDRFCREVRPRILSYDHYTMMMTDPERPEHIDSYFSNMELFRRKGLEYGIPTCFVLLSTEHGPYRHPTLDDLRWQVYTALAYGNKGLMYFTYLSWFDGDASFSGLLDRNGVRMPHYENAKKLNADVLAMAPVLLKLRSTGVFHTGEVPRDCVPATPDIGLRVESDLPLVIGLFEHEDRSRWAMVVNRHLRRPGRADLNVAGNESSLILVPGEGKLICLSRAGGTDTQRS